MSLYISAAHKSSGKTTVSLGLCAAMAKRGLSVQPFKKGPDFIDPIWLSRAARRPCLNLDFYTSSDSEVIATFNHYSTASDIQIIEGNKGLYDGVSLSGADSNAAMAKLLKSPVILVIDTQGMTRGIAALLQGYTAFDREVRIAGVVLNRVGGPRHEAKLIESVEAYTDLKVYGAIHKLVDETIEERHLGLVPANEDNLADKKIERLSDAVSAQLDIDALISLGKDVRPAMSSQKISQVDGVEMRIAIAMDSAFGFYYQDDLDAFKQAGAKLIPFSPIQDTQLPEADGLFLGGGFPERHMEALETNQLMRESIKQAIELGMPTYAECGGLMYLSKEIQWQSKRAAGVGVIPAKTLMQQRPQGRGYMQLKETGASLWPDGELTNIINAHEFHYSQLEELPDSTDYAYEVVRGSGINQQRDGIVYKNLLANYAHLRDSRQHRWVSRFVSFVRQQRLKTV